MKPTKSLHTLQREEETGLDQAMAIRSEETVLWSAKHPITNTSYLQFQLLLTAQLQLMTALSDALVFTLSEHIAGQYVSTQTIH